MIVKERNVVSGDSGAWVIESNVNNKLLKMDLECKVYKYLQNVSCLCILY
jgi:hypothetical protein